MASKVYKISFDYEDYLNLDLDVDDVADSMEDTLGEKFWDFSWDLTALKNHWGKLEATFEDVGLGSDKLPDVTIWNASCLFLSPAAYKTLSDSLQPYGEFLPVKVNDEAYYVFNCLNAVKADKSISEADIQEGLWQGIKSIGFADTDIEKNLIFKTKFDRCSALYCGEALKTLIESSNLKGLLFNSDLLSSF